MDSPKERNILICEQNQLVDWLFVNHCGAGGDERE